MERIRLPALNVRIDGARIPAHTFLGYAGANQLTLSTSLPGFDGTELHSSYLGHPDAAEALASHLALSKEGGAQTWAATHSASELPVSHSRRRCLYDHALELQELLACATDAEVTVELADRALELVEDA